MGQGVDPLGGPHASTDANGSIIAVLTPCGHASSARHLGSESCCVRICPALLACGLLFTVPTAPDAQPRPGPRRAAPAGRTADAAKTETLKPILEVALDAQPAAPAAFDAATAYLPLKGGRLVAIDVQSGRVR